MTTEPGGNWGLFKRGEELEGKLTQIDLISSESDNINSHIPVLMVEHPALWMSLSTKNMTVFSD